MYLCKNLKEWDANIEKYQRTYILLHEPHERFAQYYQAFANSAFSSEPLGILQTVLFQMFWAAQFWS